MYLLLFSKIASLPSMLLKIILYRRKPRFRIAKTGLPVFWKSQSFFCSAQPVFPWCPTDLRMSSYYPSRTQLRYMISTA
jgi:hypothetical protein